MPDPASIVRPISRLPSNGDIADQIVHRLYRLVQDALNCETAEEFLQRVPELANEALFKVLALNEVDPIGGAAAAPPATALDDLIELAEAWGGYA